MKNLAEQFATITAELRNIGHPIELNWVLEPQYLKAAQAITSEEKLPKPIPALCTLVTASAFDAAMHDAYGKLHGLNCYYDLRARVHEPRSLVLSGTGV